VTGEGMFSVYNSKCNGDAGVLIQLEPITDAWTDTSAEVVALRDDDVYQEHDADILAQTHRPMTNFLPCATITCVTSKMKPISWYKRTTYNIKTIRIFSSDLREVALNRYELKLN
jgi:predicted ATPase